MTNTIRVLLEKIRLIDLWKIIRIYYFCYKYNISNYKIINNDGEIMVDVNGSVNLQDIGLKKLPFKFNYINGYFDCSFNNLISLKNSPNMTVSDFNCSDNHLSSLKDAPIQVNGDFLCERNGLQTLE